VRAAAAEMTVEPGQSNTAMNSITSIALSGLQAAQSSMQASAHNIANADTPNFRPQQVVQQARPDGGVEVDFVRAPRPGVSLEADMGVMLRAKNAGLANLSVFHAFDRMTGSLLDSKA
jgi:flagellar basal body rod protein FlgB